MIKFVKYKGELYTVDALQLSWSRPVVSIIPVDYHALSGPNELFVEPSELEYIPEWKHKGEESYV